MKAVRSRRVVAIAAAFLLVFIGSVGVILGLQNAASQRSADTPPTDVDATSADEGASGSDDPADHDEPEGADEEEEEPPPPLDVDDLAAGPIEDESAEVARATDAVHAVIAASTQVAQRSDGQTEGLEAIATGFVLGELQALAVEREHLGYTQTGEAHVVSVEVISSDLDATPPELLLQVCIDVSEIDVLDAAGNSQAELLYNPGHPVEHHYGAEFTDDVWKLSTHAIPTSQECLDGEES